jgi:phosphate transport system protein
MENRIIDQQLDLLRDKLLLLGGTTEKALQRAMKSLTGRDSSLAELVLDEDMVINRMELEIDQLCIEIIALQQPAAHDLRFVISVAKITPILERIADHACSIAKAALILNNEPELKEYVDLPKMAENAAEMLHAALDAFTAEDADASREIIKQDKVINKSYKRIFGELIQMMVNDPSITNSAAQLLFASKHLERIGDYVKDICELNVYLTEAAFIKHSKKK